MIVINAFQNNKTNISKYTNFTEVKKYAFYNVENYNKNIFNDCFVPQFKGIQSQIPEGINHINQLHPKQIRGILEGIGLFKGMQPEDLYILPGTIDILTQRGCSNHCLHCFVKAREKFSSMKWEDFSKFTEGMKELKKRLGFHVFEIKREKYDLNRRDYTLSQGLYPYLDADPIEIKSLDRNGKIHYIDDFVKKYYEDMGAPLKVKTVGWDINNHHSQKAAERLTRLLTSEKYQNACPIVIVSMHPFHKIMTSANNALRRGDYNKYTTTRQEYIERMSNTLKTFLPLAEKKKFIINPQYAVGAQKDSGYTKTDTKLLCKDILTHLENDCKQNGIECSFLTGEKDIEKNTFFEPLNQILSVARSQKQFLRDFSLNTYSFERGKNGERQIVVSPFDYKHAFGNEVSENIVNNCTKQKDFIDNVVIDINPLIDDDLDIAQKNKLSTDRSKMFMEKVMYTVKRFSGLDNIIIRISYDNDTKYTNNFANSLASFLKKGYPNLNNIELQETTAKTSLQKLKSSKESFKEIIDNLNPEGKVRFVSQLRKGINVDGQIYIPIINTRSFGEDFFENRALILDGIKFNYDNPQKYIFDDILNQDKIYLDRNQVIKLVEGK